MSTILLLLVRNPALAMASSLREASTDFISWTLTSLTASSLSSIWRVLTGTERTCAASLVDQTQSNKSIACVYVFCQILHTTSRLPYNEWKQRQSSMIFMADDCRWHHLLAEGVTQHHNLNHCCIGMCIHITRRFNTKAIYTMDTHM